MSRFFAALAGWLKSLSRYLCRLPEPIRSFFWRSLDHRWGDTPESPSLPDKHGEQRCSRCGRYRHYLGIQRVGTVETVDWREGRHPQLRISGKAAGLLLLAAMLALTGCSSFTVRGDLSHHVAGKWGDWLQRRDGTWHDANGSPRAMLSLGFEPQLTDSLSASVGIAHYSYITTNADRGEERVYAGLAWKPFREVNSSK